MALAQLAQKQQLVSRLGGKAALSCSVSWVSTTRSVIKGGWQAAEAGRVSPRLLAGVSRFILALAGNCTSKLGKTGNHSPLTTMAQGPERQRLHKEGHKPLRQSRAGVQRGTGSNGSLRSAQSLPAGEGHRPDQEIPRLQESLPHCCWELPGGAHPPAPRHHSAQEREREADLCWHRE